MSTGPAGLALMGRPGQFAPQAAVGEAMDAFWRKGYAATTPQDLPDALGIGEGSLYNAFAPSGGFSCSRCGTWRTST